MMHSDSFSLLFRFRVFYFLSYGAIGALFPYLPLRLNGQGFSPTQIAIILLLIPFSGSLLAPLWGSAADLLQARIQLLRLTSFGSALSLILLYRSEHFVPILLSMGLFCFFRAPIPAIIDAATSAAMNGQHRDFGRVRVFGSIGFLCFVLLVGYLDGSHHPAILFGTTGAAFFLSGLVALSIRSLPFRREQGILRHALRFVSQRVMILFLVANTLYYVGHGIFDGFFSLYLRRRGFGDAFVGKAWAFGVVLEVCVMVAAPRILDRYRSAQLLALCAAVAALRWFLMTMALPGPSLLLIQTLHGITYGLWYVSLVRFIQGEAPERLRTCLQGVTLSSIGIGVMSGYFFGGLSFDHLDEYAAFVAATASALVALAIYATLTFEERSHVAFADPRS